MLDIGEVIPLHHVGVTDSDAVTTSIAEMSSEAFRALMNDGKYVVRRGSRPLHDFNDKDTLMQSHPCLFPYGRGGFVEDGESGVTFERRGQYFMRYADGRFRRHRSFIFEVFSVMQKRQIWRGAAARMKSADFIALAPSLLGITNDDMKKAAKEEEERLPISDSRIRKLRAAVKSSGVAVMGSNQSRTNLRMEIWATIAEKGAPFIWATVNPNDIHDPIVQFITGEDINLDEFQPSSANDHPSARIRNVASDPYAAAKFFRTVVNSILVNLVGIEVVRRQVSSRNGIFGVVDAYFGVVEAQGRGTLHVHFLFWLKNTPDSSKLYALFQDEAFRHRVKTYMSAVIKADLDGFDDRTYQSWKEARVPSAPNPSFNRPPDPSDSAFDAKFAKHLRDVVANSQYHTCTRVACQKVDRYGRTYCKRRAPWELSTTDVVRSDGSYAPKRTIANLNNFNETISAYVMCNNDVKLITSGSATNDLAWYLLGYMSKDPLTSYNMSALLANGRLFDEAGARWVEGASDIPKAARALIVRCFNTLTREQEVPAPMVVSYIMGWGDTFKSHSYVSVSWGQLTGAILEADPTFKELVSILMPCYL